MLAIFSESFITAARMDGFSHVRSPAAGALTGPAPELTTARPWSALARVLAALPLMIRPRP